MRKKKSERNPGDRRAIGRAARYLARYPRQAVLPYLFLILATFAQLAVPRMVRNVIDTITQHLQAPRADTSRLIFIGGAAIVFFALLRGFFAFLQTYWAEKNSQGVAFDLRNDLYAKIQNLSFSYHDRTNTGQLMIRATDDIEKVRLFIGQGLLQLVSAVLLLTGTLVLIFSINARLAWVVIWILPVALLLFMAFGTISRPLFSQVQQRLSALNTTLQENLAGIRVVKAFTRELSEQAKFNHQSEQLMNQQLFIARLFTFLFPLIFLIASLGQATIVYAGGKQVIQGTLTLGEWQEFGLYLIYLFFPIAQFGFIITQLSQASASAARVFEILDAESDVKDKPGAVPLPQVKGDVKFENVTFRYFSSGNTVLDQVDFEAKAGQTVALLGATGSGKTTIINLLPRFYDPTQGKILIDGNDIREVTLDSLRAQIGIVLQETTLFGGTIRENIAFGKPDATLDQIVAAAQASAAHEFILSFPDGYDTKVGERGATLSGGQKQRIAIARALLLEPRILILDDSTSSVDLATEAQIQNALDTLMKGRTSFVIAQRISTVMNADLILVLENGRIAAQGTHRELLEDSEIYAEIYSSQLIEDTPRSEPLG